MTLKVYLAHPLDARKEVREAELAIEQLTGVELLNPFYDTGREDIHEIDAGRLTRWQVPASTVVEKDIGHIIECDAFAAVLVDGLSIGTIMEIVYAHIHHKRVWIIDLAGKGNHPWIRHHASKIFDSWTAFEGYLASSGYDPLERLAELEHEQWAAWAREILRTEPDLTFERKDRWSNLLEKKYGQLTFVEQERDRMWARRALDCMEDQED